MASTFVFNKFPANINQLITSLLLGSVSDPDPEPEPDPDPHKDGHPGSGSGSALDADSGSGSSSYEMTKKFKTIEYFLYCKISITYFAGL